MERDLGPVSVALHNIGPNIRQSVLETTSQRYAKMFEIAAGSALIMGREVAKRMAERGSGVILFTGATASLRGGAGFASFSSAMAAKRMLAQSMARELGPKGIHVAHVIVDGAIDTPFHASEASPIPREVYHRRKANDGIIDPDAIAAAFVQLAQQPRSAWTFELDLRPWDESW